MSYWIETWYWKQMKQRNICVSGTVSNVPRSAGGTPLGCHPQAAPSGPAAVKHGGSDGGALGLHPESPAPGKLQPSWGFSGNLETKHWDSSQQVPRIHVHSWPHEAATPSANGGHPLDDHSTGNDRAWAGTNGWALPGPAHRSCDIITACCLGCYVWGDLLFSSW